MIVEALGRKYQIGFNHDPCRKDENGKSVKCSRCSECYICELTDPYDKRQRTVVSQGVAMCNKEDQFVRDRGRKLALTRALARIFPHVDGADGAIYKEVRRMFWLTYLSRGTK